MITTIDELKEGEAFYPEFKGTGGWHTHKIIALDRDKMDIPFTKPTIGREEIEAVTKVMKGELKDQTKQFEQEFAKYVGVKYAIFTNSCTSALKMSYKWLKENSDTAYLYYPDNTFCATYAAGVEMGWKMYPYSSTTGYSEGKTPHYDNRVNVHYGSVKDERPCLIEDSAHRIEPNDPLVGKIRCYSFHATKNMTCNPSGGGANGGMFVTNNKEIYEYARLLWNDGTTRDTDGWDYKVKVMAGGYDGNELLAAIGRVQLKKLPRFNKKRQQIVSLYNEAFNTDWKGNHLYPYMLTTTHEVKPFIEYMEDNGIQCAYHYPGTGWTGVSLPLYPSLTKKQIEYIIEKVNSYTLRSR